jgi:hypothetical protein
LRFFERGRYEWGEWENGCVGLAYNLVRTKEHGRMSAKYNVSQEKNNFATQTFKNIK